MQLIWFSEQGSYPTCSGIFGNNAKIKSFFDGNEYYLFIYETFTDIRLVGAPPRSIGKYGGDTDNWEWPRHTGDFSLFRVYTDENGNSADYSTNNVPLKAKYHLPVNIDGVKENDFAMILGYPGRTNRWMPADGVEQNVKFAYPAWVEASKLSMDVMKKYMVENEEVNLMYTSKYAGIANYWKNRQGMIDALTAHKTVESKREVENKFQKWANKKQNVEKYGSIISNINNYYSLTNDKARHGNYLYSLIRSSKFSVLPSRLGRSLENYANSNEAKREELKPQIDKVISEVLDSAQFINGDHVKSFQKELSEYLSVKHVITCANGTDALQIAMMGLGLKPGDEVITPSFTYIATTEVIGLLGLKPVFVDCDTNTFNISVEQIKKAITKNTLVE